MFPWVYLEEWNGVPLHLELVVNELIKLRMKKLAILSLVPDLFVPTPLLSVKPNMYA